MLFRGGHYLLDFVGLRWCRVDTGFVAFFFFFFLGLCLGNPGAFTMLAAYLRSKACASSGNNLLHLSAPSVHSSTQYLHVEKHNPSFC